MKFRIIKIGGVEYVAISRHDSFLVWQVQEAGSSAVRTCFQVGKGSLEVEVQYLRH